MAAIPSPMVYLLREPSSPDPYEEAFRAAGFRVRSLPVLRFAFVNRARLRALLARPEAYGGLVVTSPRAVEALAEALSPDLRASWCARPAYAVGPRTAAALRALGFRPLGEESGHAEALAARIEGAPDGRPLLFLCGNRRRETLPRLLAEAGCPFEEVTVYRTLPAADLDLTGAPAAAWVAFFSPSGVETARTAHGIDWARVRKAAIGGTTAEAVTEAFGRVDAVAGAPTPEALVAAVRAAAAG